MIHPVDHGIEDALLEEVEDEAYDNIDVRVFQMRCPMEIVVAGHLFFERFYLGRVLLDIPVEVLAFRLIIKKWG